MGNRWVVSLNVYVCIYGYIYIYARQSSSVCVWEKEVKIVTVNVTKGEIWCPLSLSSWLTSLFFALLLLNKRHMHVCVNTRTQPASVSSSKISSKCTSYSVRLIITLYTPAMQRHRPRLRGDAFLNYLIGWMKTAWQKNFFFFCFGFIFTGWLVRLLGCAEIITSGSLGMIKGKRLPVEFRLFCLQIEL